VALPGGVQLCFASYLRSEAGATGAGESTDAKPQLPIAWRAAVVNRPMYRAFYGSRSGRIHAGIRSRVQAVAGQSVASVEYPDIVLRCQSDASVEYPDIVLHKLRRGTDDAIAGTGQRNRSIDTGNGD